MNYRDLHRFRLKYLYFITVMMIFFLFSKTSWSQIKKDTNQVNPNGYNVFYHENGQKSSEGLMRNGKPDGYWKTYYKNGVLKSEGNRDNFKLDSTWKFYSENGELILKINYEDGKKNGLRTAYSEEEIIEEPFVNDVKQGTARYYYPDGTLKKTIFYADGLADGFSKVYEKDGRVITLIEYKKGYIVSRKRINRYDRQNRRNGSWKWFYDEGTLRMEGIYSHGLKDGYFKQYDRDGNLQKVEKYVNGELQEDAQEVVDLEIITDYYPDGSVKTVGTYKDGVPQGIRREYDKEGNISQAYIFKNGQIIGEGIIKENGKKNGSWVSYYQNGKIKARGTYDDNVKVGKWTYYYPNGQVEQTGRYNNKGKPDGDWTWYYQSGNVLREESFYNGLKEGLMTEYSESGNVIIQGEYIAGTKNGFWNYNYGDHREEGSYSNDLRSGEWKYFYPDSTLHFKGSYIDGNPNGKHIYYWDNGNRKIEGHYIMGRKHKQWIKYNRKGEPYLIITYQNGVEKSYDGVQIKPPMMQ
ncbi:MAG: hypothetical protein K9I94_03920 [Bacteroidales bacterium]|nr:hypothetical protein [Bacteroidales bacterium]